jgi:lipoprotein-anchoring transpeptidase ErfK/SrfK
MVAILARVPAAKAAHPGSQDPAEVVDDEHMRFSPAGRLAAALVGLLLLAAGVTGCGRGDGEGRDESAAGVSVADLAPDERVVDTVLAAPTAPTAPTTTLAPLAPWQVLVAVAKPEVTELQTFDAPGGNPVTFELPLRNPWYFGGELALLVEQGRETDEWLHVAIPTRPNGTTAWIHRADVTIRSHRVHVQIALGERRVRVWDADTLLVDEPAVVGKSSTPTPLGRFFVNARIRHDNEGGAYGPWILSLSGFSEALETFDGALPEIAIHGTNRPDLIGQARSNGCIRLGNDVIRRLAEVVPLGTPVEVVA